MTGTERRLAHGDTDRRSVQVRQNVCTLDASADVSSHRDRSSTIAIHTTRKNPTSMHTCAPMSIIARPSSCDEGTTTVEARAGSTRGPSCVRR